VVINPKREVSGSVVHSSGSPCLEFKVTALPPASAWTSPFAVEQILAAQGLERISQDFDDADGLFSIDLPPGTYDLIAACRDGFQGSIRDISVADGPSPNRQVIRVTEGLRISGRLVSAETGLALSGYVAAFGGADDVRADTDTSGRFSLSGVPRDRPVYLWAASPGQALLPDRFLLDVTGSSGATVNARDLPLLPTRLLSSGRASIGATLENRDGRALVLRVAPGGGAGEVGIQAGDAFVRIDGRAAKSLGPNALGVLLAGAAGTPVALEMMRGGTVFEAHPTRHE